MRKISRIISKKGKKEEEVELCESYLKNGIYVIMDIQPEYI